MFRPARPPRDRLGALDVERLALALAPVSVARAERRLRRVAAMLLRDMKRSDGVPARRALRP